MLTLTEDESRVMRLLINGATNKVVVKLLSVSLRTVESRRQSVMKKLGARSSVQLGYLYAKHESA